MGQHLEIERKFLVKRLPNGWKRAPSSRIVQGYFPTTNGVEIRLRRKGSHNFFTVKAGTGPKRREEEVALQKSQFQSLWPLTRGAQISKTRHEIAFHGQTVEVDVYHGPHRGLVTAEIEFDSMRSCRAFEPPEWLGPEITGNQNYANASLARRNRLPRHAKQH